MVARTGPTNEQLNALIADLEREGSVQNAPVWKTIADFLSAPSRQRREVNLSKLNRFTSANETIVVPGKVLGSGAIDHPVIVAAFAFSTKAKDRIESSKGKAISISQLLKQNPKATGVRLVG